eukprot:scpid94193/ scgid3927/ 
MADAGAGGKTAKKNAKRQAARAKKRLLDTSEPASGSMVSGGVTSAGAGPRSGQPSIDSLRQEMAQAKADGDVKRAQEIREQIWLLKDRAAGVLGEGFERAAASLAATAAARPSAPPAAESGGTTPRSTPAASQGPPVELTESEKRLRALNKKLQQIEKIRAAQKEGKPLESGQVCSCMIGVGLAICMVYMHGYCEESIVNIFQLGKPIASKVGVAHYWLHGSTLDGTL